MGAHLVALLAAAFLSPQDTVITYATPATEAVVVRAAVRHQAQDTSVSDYRASIRYRLSVAFGRRRWGRFPPVAVEEQAAQVAWARPNDLRVDVIGRRYRTRSPDLKLSSVFDRPWFVPRGVGDSVRIFSDEFPATGALHPLARDAAAYYHYDLVDSVSAALPGGRRVKLYAVQVIPKRSAPALVAGRLWIDAATADVVRFSFRYVGTGLFARPDEDGSDSTSTRRINAIANRLVTIDVDLEYAQQDGRYWMPFRQAIAGTVSIPLSGGAVIPFQAVTEFSDYEINTGVPIPFALALPDSTSTTMREARRDSLQAEREGRARDERGWDYAGRWPGGRFEVHRPSNDSLATYAAWGDSLSLENAAEDDARIRAVVSDLARLSEELPGQLTDRRAFSYGYERVRDAIQYNRVQGLSLGIGGRATMPGITFADLYATTRYGFSDKRVTGRLAFVRDAPGGRLTIAGYHEVRDVDPFAAGLSLANSANALFTAHDDGDYLLATGGEATFLAAVALATDVEFSVRGERQRSLERTAHSAVNDVLGGTGLFPLNPPVQEGDFALASARVLHYGSLRWTLGVEGLTGKDLTTGRAMGAMQWSRGGARGLTLRMKAGIAESSAPAQLQFRLGGTETVRGFEYGTLMARSFWSAQLDVSPLKGTIRPVAFIDAGQAAAPDQLFRSKALVGGGFGVSVYSPLLRTTLIRMDLSHPITPDNGSQWRFDLVFSPVR